MGQITATRNLVATKVVRLAGQIPWGLSFYCNSLHLFMTFLLKTSKSDQYIYASWYLFMLDMPMCPCTIHWGQGPLLLTLRPRQNGPHFADDIFKCIFLNENVWISIIISLRFVPTGPINNIPALVQMMAWCRPGDKPLSESMMVSLPTHICVTRP